MYERTRLPAVVGEATSTWFWLKTGERVLNMTVENFRKARERFIEDGLVDVAIWDQQGSNGRVRSFALVLDSRIPQNFLQKDPCFGADGLSHENTIEACELIGDPHDQLLYFTDPVAYYAQRGGVYDPEKGIVTYKVDAQPRKLNVIWSVEAMPDMVSPETVMFMNGDAQ